jgi:hypothetical protein
VWAAGGHDAHHAHKAFWLSPGFFLGRAAFYLLVWGILAELFLGWSTNQDLDGDPGWTARQRRLGGAALPLAGLTLTFASFDWVMSLHPTWFSTIFGVYVFAGDFVGAVALLVVVLAAADRSGLLDGLLTRSHWHSLGKLLFAFVCFWAYIAFCQYMLIWIGNLPEEIPWYLVRARGAWAPVGAILFVGHFVLPFLALLPRWVKRQPAALAGIAAWVLAMHWLDVYWTVMPRLHPDRAAPHASDLTALVGIGGAAVAVAILRLRGRAPVPVGDPALAASAEYRR